MNLDNTVSEVRRIGTIGFPFYWFGVDYGSTNNIYWNTPQALTFGYGYNYGTTWTAKTAKGFFIG